MTNQKNFILKNWRLKLCRFHPKEDKTCCWRKIFHVLRALKDLSLSYCLFRKFILLTLLIFRAKIMSFVIQFYFFFSEKVKVFLPNVPGSTESFCVSFYLKFSYSYHFRRNSNQKLPAEIIYFA